MKQISNRNQLAELLIELGLTGEAAFIGCAECYYESYFAERWPGHANWIDPWRVLNTPGFSGHGEDTDKGQEERYHRILAKAQKFNGRVKVIRATSEEAAPRFGNGTLDFVYIDADHSLDAARQDIALWAPKVKRGGILAGHDYLEGMHNGQLYGVKQAVAEFAAKSNLSVNVTQESDWPSWWLRREPAR